MPATKTDIRDLQQQLLSLQGLRPLGRGEAVNIALGPVLQAFPHAAFPLGAVHEFIYTQAEAAAATGGFISGILSSLMQAKGVSVWISSSRTVFPPALQSFGIAPDQIIFIDLRSEKDLLWAMEEALKTAGLAAVVGEVQDLSFTASRRLQLAVEKSRVTGFIIRRRLSTTACVTRWQITSLPSETTDELPGVGFPRWKVELLKVRNGRPGTWDLEWSAGRFRPLLAAALPVELQKKAG